MKKLNFPISDMLNPKGLTSNLDKLLGGGAFAAIRAQQEMWTKIERLVGGPGLALQNEMTKSLRLMSGSLVEDLLRPNNSLKSLMAQVNSSAKLLDEMTRLHHSWQHPFLGQDIAPDLLNKHLLSSMSSTNTLMEQASRLFQTITFERFEPIALRSPHRFSRFQKTSIGFVGSYGYLLSSIESPSDYGKLPKSTYHDSSQDLVLAANAIAIVQPDEEAREESFTAIKPIETELEDQRVWYEPQLRSIDPGLLRPLQGAIEAISSQNVDRSRHVLTSLREFWWHFMRAVSPDDEALLWINGNADLLDARGKPTRAARIGFIVRAFESTPLSTLLVQDTKAFVEMLNFFNHLHQLDGPLDDRQLKVLLYRTESWLLFILRLIREGTN